MGESMDVTTTTDCASNSVGRTNTFSGMVRQLPLMPATVNGNGGNGFRDPAFGQNKSLPVHRWVPWIAGYSASFVDDVVSSYPPPGNSAVLDPFCGVGTTLLQATLRGKCAVGFEINPYAALACRAKLGAVDIQLSELDAALAAMEAASAAWGEQALPQMAVPPLKSRIPFFSPKIERKVLHVLSFVRSIDSPPIADLFRVAFGAVMVSFSNYTYEPSLGSRPAAGRPLVDDADVQGILRRKLWQMRTDIAWIQQETDRKLLGTGRVFNSDFFESGALHMPNGSAGLMITSPPYMNNYHYVRNTRPQLYWLDFISSPSQQKRLETQNFGQYWQTVRDAEPLPLGFEHGELQDIIRRLRETRADKGAYGGPGWANYVTAYFNDCYRFMRQLEQLLIRHGVGVVVIGNSIIQGINVETHRILSEIAAMNGLRPLGVHCIREKRVGASITRSSVRHGANNGATLSEFAVIVRKG